MASPCRARRVVFAVFIALWVPGCGSLSYPVEMERLIRPTLDVSPFQSVLVAGFATSKDADIDLNEETVRLLRSQLRTKTGLRVIDAEAPPIAMDATGPTTSPAAVFTDVVRWRRIGEEFKEPLIITGSIELVSTLRHSLAPAPSEPTIPGRGTRKRLGQQELPAQPFAQGWESSMNYVLQATLIFIDGRTGVTMCSESVREEVAHDDGQKFSTLAVYFELMDRLVPDVLYMVSAQNIRTTRVLLD